MKLILLSALVATAFAASNHTSHQACYEKVHSLCGKCFGESTGTPMLRAATPLIGRPDGHNSNHGPNKKCLAPCILKNKAALAGVCHFPSEGPKKVRAARTGLEAFARPAGEVSKMFVAWAKEHGWNSDFTVSNDEYAKREAIFGDNLAYIEKHNAEHAAGKHSFTMAMNQFGHLTREEFSARNGFSPLGGVDAAVTARRVADYHTASEVERRRLWAPSPSPASDTVDWVKKGAVTEVKNQGQCGSCWSFSAAGAIEGAMYIANGKTESLGNQELVSCDGIDNGCGGGAMDNAFNWVKENKGIASWEDYPYTGTDGTCKRTSVTNVDGSAVTGYKDVSEGQNNLEKAVAKQPVSVAIEADQESFQFYKSGVMSSECGTQLDHGVLAVGYGTEDGSDYWLIKNSWGASWGEDGYIKIERGNSQTGGQCGILMMASYPSV